MGEAETLVVGAGPAGLLAAMHLESDTLVLESRPRIGYPPHCAGIVSTDTLSRLPREALVEYYDGLYVSLASLTVFLRVRLARVDRPLLEEILLEDVKSRGMRVTLRCRVDAVEEMEKGFIARTTCGTVKTGNLVIAEGASARLASSLGYRKPRLIHGYQLLLGLNRSLSVEPYAPLAVLVGGDLKYFWVIPLDGGQRILIGAAGKPSHVLRFLRRAVKILYHVLGVKSVVEVRGGPIPYTAPLLRPWRVEKGRWVVILGDAAGMVKASSGGGLYAITRASPLPWFLEKGREKDAANIYRHVYHALLRLYIASRIVYASRRGVTFVSKLLRLYVEKKEPIIADYDELGVVGWASRFSGKSHERSSGTRLPNVYGNVLRLLETLLS